ncbi:MAG: hypothetical protein IPG07_10240 [Crocinitomicaceae bacterium]|nr:hypothetical protein [Crocinitomicaceae bacterium]
MKQFKKIAGLFLMMIASQAVSAQGNEDCDQMEPICTDAGLSFTAQTGVTIEPGQ